MQAATSSTPGLLRRRAPPVTSLRKANQALHRHPSTPFVVHHAGSVTQRGVPVAQFKADERTEAIEAPTAVAEAEGTASVEKINFWDYWWPVAPVSEMDTTRPTAVDLLGMKLVLWIDSTGTWHCLQDRCPHKLAPLSEGEVLGDQLMCSYHGWKFNASGACTSIPQIDDPKAHATACASGRTCTKVYPIKVVHGLLWVFPKPGAEGAAAAAAQPMPSTAVPALLEAEADPEGSNNYQSTAWYFRDLPLRYDTLVENIIDPSHVPFAHHTTPGIRRENNVNGVMKAVHQPEGPITAKGGFWVTKEATATTKESTCGVVPPNRMSYFASYSDQHFYCVPTKPGWSRIIMCVVGKKDVPVPKPLRLMADLMRKYPVIEHLLLRHEILDGDTYMLHVAEREFLAAGNSARAYFLPANADLPTVQWRKWLSRHAEEVPTCRPTDQMPAMMTKEQALDRYSQHTCNCKTCRNALKGLDQATAATTALGVVSSILTAASMPAVTSSTVFGAVMTMACAAIVMAMKNLRQKFFYVEYVYAHKAQAAEKPAKR